MTLLCPERSLCETLLAAAFGPVESCDTLFDEEPIVCFNPISCDGSFDAGIGACGHLWEASLTVGGDKRWEGFEPTPAAAFIALASATAAYL